MRKLVLTLFSSAVLYNYSIAQTYCSVSGTNCNVGDVITNVTIDAINNTTTCSPNGDTSFTTPVPTLYKTLIYPISVTVGSGGTENVGVWIDYDHSGTFDASEFTSIGSGNGTTISSNITIPGTATTGNTTMRVRVRWSSPLTGADACLSYTYGETEDYIVNIGTATACSGTPTAGTATASTDSVCSESFNLTLTGYTSGVSGITFQWQSSSTGITGSFTNITGATSSTYTTTLTATTYYQCVVTCSGSSATSNMVTVIHNSPSDCYCEPTNDGGACIKNVTFSTLSHTTAGCENSPSNYTLVPAGTTTTTVAPGQTYPLSVSIDSTNSAIISVWIDYNQNGVFDSTEWNQVATNAAASSTSTINVTVSGSAVAGQTRMRVRSRISGNNNGAGDACTSMGSGETEDYIVTIGTLSPCSGTPTAGTATASSDSVCSESFNLILTGYTQGVSGITFQWQSSSTGTTGSFTNITGATTSIYSITQTVTTYYQCVVTCSGSSATSTVVNVISSPFMNCYCISAATYDSDEDIFNVTVGTLNNTSSCTTTGGIGSVLNKYSNYMTVTAPNLAVDSSIAVSVQIGTCDTSYFYKNAAKVYIDYNQNGSFTEANELVYASDTALGPHTVTGSFTVPSTAINGNTLMRVVCKETPDTSSISACGTYSYGETEDYIVNITGSTVGIAINELLNNVLIYPNPSSGLFNIVMNNANFNQLTINVIDIQGKVVYNTTDKSLSSNYNKQINLEGLAKGLYYIKLSTESGVKVQKLIVQ